ncbi:MAG: glycosyltransferase family 2 protein [Pseudonocardiales bacterium]
MRAIRWLAAAAAAGSAHAAVNAALLRRPSRRPPLPHSRVSVLLPVRDEAHRVRACLRALVTQVGGQQIEIVVLDDGSTDGTAEVLRTVAGADPRVRLVTGRPLPAGWLGKAHACRQLADAADPASDVLVFVDADVVLAPHAVAATVDLLFGAGLDLISPYPRQLASGAGARLVQPLLQWSWLTLLPLRLAERSSRPSLSAANGQLLAVRRAAYDRAGGHAAVRGEVVEDVALVRAVKATGGSGGVVDGTALAECTMYHTWADLAEGYTKSLWAAFGSPARGTAVAVALTAVYVLPPLAALRGSRAGLAGYLAAVAGRAVAARRTGGRVWPDAFAHPASVLAFDWLTARSLLARRRGTLTWKGRRLP